MGFFDYQEWEAVNPGLICPHCQTEGHIHTKPVKGKVFTQAHCDNCSSTWVNRMGKDEIRVDLEIKGELLLSFGSDPEALLKSMDDLNTFYLSSDSDGTPASLIRFLSLRAVAVLESMFKKEMKIRDAYGLCFDKKDLETIQMKLREQILCGYQNGDSCHQVAVRIRSALANYANLTLEQAMMIARTELIGKANYARYLDIKDSGFRKKEWLAAKDEEVRPLHREMHGKVINTDDLWVFSDGNTLRYPGDPEGPDHLVVNCRCIEVVVPDPLDDEE